jgi:hypothetical protein
MALALSSSALLWQSADSAQAAAAATSTPAGKAITLTGLFTTQYAKGKQTDLTAVLTPNGDKAYDVVYTFKWGGGNETWKGAIKGDLTTGEINGTGATGSRTFTFKATAVKGVMSGKTFETTGGKTVPTGDIGLKP